MTLCMNRLLLGVSVMLCAGACAQAPSGAVSERVNALRSSQAMPDIDPYTCLGTPCGVGDVEAQPAIYQTRRCDALAAEPFEVRWRREFPSACPQLGECNNSAYGGDSVTVASDGSLWLALPVSTPERDGQADAVLVSHYAADGYALSTRLLGVEYSNIGEAVDYNASIATDERNHGFVSIGKYSLREGEPQPTQQRWLAEYDEWGEPVQGDVSIAPPRNLWERYGGPLRLHSAGPGRLALAGGYTEPSVVMFGIEQRTASFVQTRDGLPAPQAIAFDPQGGFSVLTAPPYDPDTRKLAPRIEHYGADGRLAWLRSLSEPWGERVWTTLSSDRDGNLLQLGYETPDLNGPSTIWLHKLAKNGDSSWLLRIALSEENGGAGGEAPASDAEGNIYLLGNSYSEEVDAGAAAPGYGTIVFEISPDGATCRSHKVEGLFAQRLIATQAGELYFIGDGFGRLSR